MGCHTWFYVCLPDKQEKWLNEWKKIKNDLEYGK